VYRLEPLNLLLTILECDGADQVVAPAVLVNLAWVPLSMMILSTSISVSARRSTADRSSQASDGSGSFFRHGRLVGRTLVLPVQLIKSRVHLLRHSLNVWRSTSLHSFILNASFA
jgi:hypothetical protein